MSLGSRARVTAFLRIAIGVVDLNTRIDMKTRGHDKITHTRDWRR
jgi:hypothetical protein